MKKFILIFALILSALTVSLGLSVAAKAETTVRIASDNSYAPFEFQDSNKQWSGIDVDIMKEVAKINHWKLEMSYPGFDAALNTVQSGGADGIIAGMSITDARKQVFDFSEPYYSSSVTIATTKQNNYTNFSQLKGKVIGVKNGTTSQTWLQDNASKYGFTVKTYSNGSDMYAALASGSIVGAMDDEPVIQYAIKQGQNLAINMPSIPAGNYGFAVKKGTNKALITGFNTAINQMKTDGDYDKIIKKYTSASSANATKDTSENSVWGILKNNWGQLMSGLAVTLELAIVSFFFAVIVGIIFGLFSISPNKILRGVARVYIDVNRSIPLLILIFFLFFGIPNLMQMLTGQQWPMNEFLAGVIALTLNESSYIAEIVRGGVNAVPNGQMEASRSLGVPYVTTLRKVILPQATKIAAPGLINQFIITLKDTTLVSTIGLIELLQAGQIIVARNFQAFRVYGILLIFYMVVLLLLMWIGRRVEKRLK